jgi:hypothetical protein
MKALPITLLHFVFIAIAFSIPLIADAQTYAGPKCLGALCIDQKLPSKKLIERLGAPNTNMQSYRAQDDRTILSFFVSSESDVYGILLAHSSPPRPSDKNLSALTKEDLRSWKTGEGIGLDSSEKEILKVYGKPTGEYEFQRQESASRVVVKYLSYKGRIDGIVRSAMFTVQNGKVSQIEFWTQGEPGPTCLGRTCEPHSARAVFQALGKPTNVAPTTDIVCYESQDGKSFLSVEMGEREADIDVVFLGDVPNCLHKKAWPARNDLSDWKTPEGIRLGSSEEDVSQIYGKPSREETVNAAKCCEYMLPGWRKGDRLPDLGQKILHYDGLELHQAGFGIRNGKVSFIWISDSE